MSISSPLGLCLAALLTLPALSQQAPATPDRTLRLAVTVETKPGQPVTGLQPQDFTVLDNKSPRAITSVKAMTSAKEPVEVILLLDAVNTRFSTIAFERDEVRKFLLANDGQLAHPTTLAVLQDIGGTKMQQGFSTDGRAINDALTKFSIGLRDITRSSGIYGADDRLQLSLTALHQITGYAATLPGRKIILWISPGWPILSGPNITLDYKQQDQIFHDIVGFSTELRKANVTLYNINPLGPEESLIRENLYQAYDRGVKKPGDTALGNLALQVLAEQSGGLVLVSDSDISGMLKRSVDELQSWYEVTINQQPAEHPNEYHHLEVRLAQPGPKVRTRDGYYAQP